MYKDAGNTVELTMDELLLRVDKGTGSICYLTRDKKVLLTERTRECRQLESTAGGKLKAWQFLELSKKEQLYGFGSEAEAGISLKSTARYLSCEKRLPFLLSDRGYGIVIAANGPIFCCDIPAYGSYFHIESTRQLDFYFIAGKKQDTILNACAYLCGKL